MDEQRQVDNLADLAPPEWAQNPRFERARFRFFPTGIAVDSAEAATVRELFPILQRLSSHPVSFAILKTVEGTKFRSVSTEVFYAEGQRKILFEMGEQLIQAGDYMVIFSPIVSDSENTNEAVADDAIAVCRGLMTSLFGHAAADVPTYSCDSYLREVRTALPSPTIENFPSAATYAFADEKVVKALSERVETHFDASLQKRIETALLLIGSAAAVVDPAIRLVNTWIALEVACGSRGKAEEAIKLATSDASTYTRLKTARDDFFHEGVRHGLKTDDERVAHAALINVLLRHYRLSTATVIPIRPSEATQNHSASAPQEKEV